MSSEAVKRAELIDRLADQFENALRARNHARIEDYLEEVPTEAHSQALRELLALEIEYRRKRGDSVDIAAYRARFHGDNEIVEEVTSSIDSARWVHSTKQGSEDKRHNANDNANQVVDARELELPSRYRLMNELGRGSFGQVVRAHDEELKRDVAIKVLHSRRQVDPESARRLKEEARCTAAIDHPNIVPVYDVGDLGDGQYYTVSKYIDGGSLAHFLKDSLPLAGNDAACLIAAVADGLQHAHAQGFVHRDVKPDNILMDESGRPMLTDFGLALHEDRQPELRGEVSGSPAYMAPEQTLGQSHLLDGRTDIWALGVILYEMLTGRRPFRGDTVSALFDEIREREPKPPRMFNDSVPESIERICLRCLSKAIRDRYATAADLAAELRATFQSAGVNASALTKSQARLSSSKVALGLGFISVAILVGTLWILRVGTSEPGSGSAAVNTNRVQFHPKMDVLVWNQRGRALSLRDDYDAQPLAPGDDVRIEASTRVPAYLYLFWIDGGGDVLPLSPWRDFDWSRRSEVETRKTRTAFPKSPGEVTTLEGGSSVSTVLFVASETPLPDEEELQRALGRFPRMKAEDVPSLMMLINEPSEEERALLSASKASDDPILQARQFLHELLGSNAQYDAITFRTSSPEQLVPESN